MSERTRTAAPLNLDAIKNSLRHDCNLVGQSCQGCHAELALDTLAAEFPALVAERDAAVARTQRLEETLQWIADPSYVGNYEDAKVVEIHRLWATNALAAVGEAEEPQ